MKHGSQPRRAGLCSGRRSNSKAGCVLWLFFAQQSRFQDGPAGFWRGIAREKKGRREGGLAVRMGTRMRVRIGTAIGIVIGTATGNGTGTGSRFRGWTFCLQVGGKMFNFLDFFLFFGSYIGLLCICFGVQNVRIDVRIRTAIGVAIGTAIGVAMGTYMGSTMGIIMGTSIATRMANGGTKLVTCGRTFFASVE